MGEREEDGDGVGEVEKESGQKRGMRIGSKKKGDGDRAAEV